MLYFSNTSRGYKLPADFLIIKQPDNVPFWEYCVLLNVARMIRPVPVVLSVVTVPRWRPLLYARLSFSQKQLPLLPNRPPKVLQALLRPDFSNSGNAERMSWMSFEGIKTLRFIRYAWREEMAVHLSAWQAGRILTCTAVNWFYLLESDLLAYNSTKLSWKATKRLLSSSL